MIMYVRNSNLNLFIVFYTLLCINTAYGYRIKHKFGHALEGRLTIKVLEKALTYLEENPESVVEDVLLGILIARGNLQWIVSHLELNEENSSWAEDVRKLMGKCNNVIDTNNKQSRSILDKKLWIHEAEDLKKGQLQNNKQDFVLPKLDSCQSIDNYMMNGSPYDSDFCVEELFRNNCNVSNYCWFSEFNNKPHSGYKTTHRLIYLQIASKLDCKRKNFKKFSLVRAEKRRLCQQMLWEAKALHKNPNFLLTRDLFMEQIALCGFDGYEEFAPEPWRKEIRSWQGENGCFGQDMNFEICSTDFPHNNKRTKRTDEILNNCHTHVTAVATSALSFHLRVILSKLFV